MSSFSGTPIRRNIRTSADLIGQLINSARLPGEPLSDFKERVLDSYIHPASSTYDGLYNGIARELGLEAHDKYLLIDVARDSDGLPLNNKAGVEVTAKYITLYSDHIEGTVDTQISLHKRDDSYFVSELITLLEAESGWDIANVGIEDYDKSSYLQRVTSLRQVTGYQLKQSQVQNLNNILDTGNFLVGDMRFSVSTGITTEVTVDPTEDNEFKVDYSNGIIFTDIMPVGTLSFKYQKLPLVIKWSPVSIYRFHHDEFIDLITEQIKDEDDNTIDGIPTSKGSQYVNELLSVIPMYWGI